MTIDVNTNSSEFFLQLSWLLQNEVLGSRNRPTVKS